MKRDNISMGALMLLMSILVSCTQGTPQQQAQKKITHLEKELFGDKAAVMESKVPDDKLAALVQAYSDYVQDFPDDSLAPQLLFKAADVSLGRNKPNEALKYFNQILNFYHNSAVVPRVLFVKAYTLENYLGRLSDARTGYEEFVRIYPNHEYAKDARQAIKNMGKTPEELIKEFEAKNRTDENNK